MQAKCEELNDPENMIFQVAPYITNYGPGLGTR